MRHQNSPLLLSLLFLLLSTLGSCCALCPAHCCDVPTRDYAIANVSLVIQVKPEFRADFLALSEQDRNAALERAWRTARGVLPIATYGDLGNRRMPVGPTGVVLEVAVEDLMRRLAINSGLNFDDVPKGCQRDSDDSWESIRCVSSMKNLLVSAGGGQPAMQFDLGQVVHCYSKSSLRDPNR
tara:strand:+ start:116127 stop:116672 length:546 start_codon:yes stop_codon:yes gene_type:complete